MLLLILLALHVPTYTLTVIGGSGSGVYACDALVTIKATPANGLVFTQWTTHPMGAATIDAVHHRKAVVTNPDCHDLTIEAMTIPKRKS